MEFLGQLVGFILGIVVFFWIFFRALNLPFHGNVFEWLRPSSGKTGWFGILFSGARFVLRFFFPETFGLGRESARFLRASERGRVLHAGNAGLTLDGNRARLSSNDSFRNCLVVATTGGGKTSGFIIPNILCLDQASIIVTDPSGALYEKTSGDLRSRGFDVLALDPLRLERSIRYNPLASASTQRAISETRGYQKKICII